MKTLLRTSDGHLSLTIIYMHGSQKPAVYLQPHWKKNKFWKRTDGMPDMESWLSPHAQPYRQHDGGTMARVLLGHKLSYFWGRIQDPRSSWMCGDGKLFV